MKNSKHIMSFSIDLEVQERLKTTAKKRNLTASKLAQNIFEKNLPATGSTEDMDTVIFKIPNSVKNSEDELRNWLTARVDAIVKILVVEKNVK